MVRNLVVIAVHVRLLAATGVLAVMVAGCAMTPPTNGSVGAAPTGSVAPRARSSVVSAASGEDSGAAVRPSSSIAASSPANPARSPTTTTGITPQPTRSIPPVATGNGNMADPHTEPSLTAATVSVGAGVRLVVDQVQSDCCFAEGTISYLVVRDAARTLVTWREFEGGEIGTRVVGLDLTIGPGTYWIDSFQRPCDANCGYLDPPTVRCSRQATLDSGHVVRLTVRWSVRDSECSFSG